MTTQFATKTYASAPTRRASKLPGVNRPVFVECVADVCRELREANDDVQLIDVSYWSRISQGAVSRFESRESHPRDLDRLVVCYGKALGVDPAQIMREALQRWEDAGGAELPTSPLPKGPLLPPDGQIEKRARAVSQRNAARKRREKRDRDRRRGAE